MRITWQQSENSAAAQPVMNKMPHLKTVQCKIVAVTNMSNKSPACCPGVRGQEQPRTEGRQFQCQPVDLGLRHGMSGFVFFFLSSDLSKGKGLFYVGNQLTCI